MQFSKWFGITLICILNFPISCIIKCKSYPFKQKSKFTSDKMSNMTEDKFYPWTEKELSILKKHEEYHKYMVDYIQGLIREGPTSFLPKKPQQAYQ